MAEHGAGFKLYADVTQFERGMAQASKTAGEVGKKMAGAFDGRAIGRTLATALGLSLTDIADKVARFWTGFSKDAEQALNDMVASTDKAADMQERALEKLREKKKKEADESFERSMKERDMVRDAIVDGIKEREKAFKKEKEERLKVAGEIAAFEDEQAFKKLDNQGKINFLRNEEKNLAKIISDHEADRKKNGIESAESEENLLDAKKQLAGVQEKLKELTTQTVAEEKKVTEEVKEQERLKLSINTIGRGDRELSDVDLAKKIKTLKSDVLSREVSAMTSGGVFTGANTSDLLLGVQKTNLSRVLEEQSLRASVRRNAQLFGEERALQMFGGSEQRFRDIVSGVSENQMLARKTAEGIQELNNRIKQGIPVVNLNT